MQIINDTEFSSDDIFYKAMMHSNYTKGDSDISVTTLIKPPQIVMLEKRHFKELTMNASKTIKARIGSAVHQAIEDYITDNPKDGLWVEERLYKDVLGVKIGGQADLYDNGALSDHKTTGSYAKGKGKSEWDQQLNILAELCEVNGYPVTSVQINAVYPDTGEIQPVPIELWSKERRVAFMEERVRLHQEAEKGNVQPCSDEDRWASPAKFAVMKTGRKSAVKLHDTMGYAVAHLDELGRGHYVEERPRVYRRCEDYCPANKFCPQWQAYLAENPPTF